MTTPSAPAGSFRIRQAAPGDFQALLDFYAANQSAALPIPTPASVLQARTMSTEPNLSRRIQRE